MKAELYGFLLENKFKNGIMFKRSMEAFVEHYNMEGTVEEDSLMRAFQRWRKLTKDSYEKKVFDIQKYFFSLLCCITHKSVFDTPNKSVTFTPEIR